MSSKPRRVAWEVLRRVHNDDAYSHIALSTALDASDLTGPDRGLATAIVYGVLTWERAIDRLLDRGMKRGLSQVPEEVLEALRIGVFQLRFMDRVPAHAAIHETVELVREIGHSRQTGLCNAVLRQISDANDDWWGANPTRKPARWLGERWSLPNWLANRLVQHFGIERATSIAEAFTKAPPIWLRRPGVGPEQLKSLGADARAEISAGKAVVQDIGAQRVVELCRAEAGTRVLDACAGLGGKTLYLAETADVLAVDPSRSKLYRLEETATLLGVREKVTVRPGELSSDVGEAFDGVLVDAPCTGLGVIGRHPETRWRRKEPDIQSLAKVQSELLDIAAELVKPGGWLVYSVCTWTREETSKQVEKFLDRHPDYQLDGEFLETMPDTDSADGFFGARLVRDEG